MDGKDVERKEYDKDKEDFLALSLAPPGQIRRADAPPHQRPSPPPPAISTPLETPPYFICFLREGLGASSGSEPSQCPSLAPVLPPTDIVPSPPAPTGPSPPCDLQPSVPIPASAPNRNKSRTRRTPRSVTIEPPHQWATDRRAKSHSMDYLLSNGIRTVSGDMECKRCGVRRQVSFDLPTKFDEVVNFIIERKHTMHDRAPTEWSNPVLRDCRECGQPNTMQPVLSPKKRSINWLFLLLSQTLGLCNLKQLRYFCKHTETHRTGAKDRLLYYTYLALCKQLVPNGPLNAM